MWFDIFLIYALNYQKAPENKRSETMACSNSTAKRHHAERHKIRDLDMYPHPPSNLKADVEQCHC